MSHAGRLTVLIQFRSQGLGRTETEPGGRILRLTKQGGGGLVNLKKTPGGPSANLKVNIPLLKNRGLRPATHMNLRTEFFLRRRSIFPQFLSPCRHHGGVVCGLRRSLL